MKNLCIGIDPDVAKSGVAIWNKTEKRFDAIMALGLADMIDLLIAKKPVTALVVVEAGFLNKGNRHTFKGQSVAAAAKTGENVGRNHERGMVIVELLEWMRIPYRLQKPSTKNSWKNDEKIFQKMTGVKGGNPEKRDAAMLVFGL